VTHYLKARGIDEKIASLIEVYGYQKHLKEKLFALQQINQFICQEMT